MKRRSVLQHICAILAASTEGLRRLCQATFSLFSPSTVAALCGVALVAYGLWQTYEPLAFIIPGLALTAFGLWLAGMFKRTG